MIAPVRLKTKMIPAMPIPARAPATIDGSTDTEAEREVVVGVELVV